MQARRLGRIGFGVVTAAIYAFLLAPLVIVMLSALNAGTYLRFPPQGLSVRWFVEFAHSRSFMNSLGFSLWLAATVTVVTTILGTMASLWLTRASGRFRSALQVLIIAPLAVPGILTGIALLLFFYTLGWRQTGLPDLVIGHTLICVPYVVLIVGAVLARQDKTLVEAAHNLGAGPLRTFWRVTLPLSKGGIICGAVFAFVTSYDDFNISLLLSGVGATPLPIQLFDYLRFSFDPTPAVAGTISIAITVFVVLLVQRLIGLDALYFGRGQ